MPQGSTLLEGIRTGREGGPGIPGIFTTIFTEVAKAKTRRMEEDKVRDKEDKEFLQSLQKLSFGEKIKGEEARKTQRVKGEEERITKRLFPSTKRKVEPLTLEGVKSLTEPIVAGPGGRAITGEEPEGEFTTTQGILSQAGFRAKGTIGGEIVAEPETRKTAGITIPKPFRLTPQREDEFKQSLQNGLSALQGQVVNPATGEPYTSQEIFRTLAAQFPGQANRLKTILLSGGITGTEDFENILFGE